MILSMESKGYIDRIEYCSPNEMDKLKRHIQDGDLCEIVDKDLKAIFLVFNVKFFDANGIRFTLGLVRLL
ncbi:hypothetical protein SAMN05660236_0525 [Ohtaekwangia koreensis]|uniref:Uncharacterized protein n=1 Tax=Ohtaekwangia koreensis TaxID=688867 RepID=A0A1T5IXR6_9BACT|nr:hypothetical protein SAMN05660236_0525 [Ohtaekwangia koreensis]